MVRHRHEGGARVAGVGDGADHPRTRRPVEPGERLVEEEHRRVGRERPREEEPPQLAVGEGEEVARGEVRDPEPAERGAGAGPLALRRGLGEADRPVEPGEHDRLPRRVEPVPGLELGRDDADLPAEVERARALQSEPPDRARRGLLLAGEEPEEGGLPGAVRADDGDPLAAAQGEVDPGEDGAAVDEDGGVGHVEQRVCPEDVVVVVDVDVVLDLDFDFDSAVAAVQVQVQVRGPSVQVQRPTSKSKSRSKSRYPFAHDDPSLPHLRDPRDLGDELLLAVRRHDEGGPAPEHGRDVGEEDGARGRVEPLAPLVEQQELRPGRERAREEHAATLSA